MNQVLQTIQVSYDISSERTRKRELRGLVLASEITKCKNLLLITDHTDEDVVLGEKTIKIRSIVDCHLLS